MKHKDFKKKIKHNELRFFDNSIIFILFLWISLFAAFVARSWIIVFFVAGLVTIWNLISTTYLNKVYDDYLFLSYTLDDMLETLKEIEYKSQIKKKKTKSK